MRLSKNQHISFESLRGLSAILVMLCHIYQIYISKYYPQYGYHAAITAQSCVMIFFVMSGFLVRMSIENNIERNSKFSLGEYAASRLMRIIPPLIFCIALCFSLFYISRFIPDYYNLPNDVREVRGRMLATDSRWVASIITFTNGFIFQNKLFNAPLWSLPFEFWFYVIAGLLTTRKILLVFISLLLIATLSEIRIDFLYYIIVWASGFFACMYRNKIMKIKCVSFVISLLLSIPLYYSVVMFLDKKVDISIYNLSFGVFFVFLSFWMIIVNDIKISILNNSSKYSYTLYLIHFPIIIFTYGMLSDYIQKGISWSIFASVVSVFFSISISYYSSKVFENKEILRKIT
ncbi:TPA: acyltransferase family protein [Providencia alcalifaciens]